MKDYIILLTIIGFISLAECQRFMGEGKQGSMCTAPNGESGICIRIRECNSQIALLRKANQPKIVEYLKKSVCGYNSNKEPIVCCTDAKAKSLSNRKIEKPGNDVLYYPDYPKIPPPPNSSIINAIAIHWSFQEDVPYTLGSKCTAPNGEPGICHLITDCASQLELLKKKKQPGVFDYLRKFIRGFDNLTPIVCCTDNMTKTQSDGKTEQPANVTYPRMPSPPICGISHYATRTKLRGGDRSSLGAWPWMTALGYRSKLESQKFMGFHCGGSLVSNQHVITAARCTKHKYLTLYVARFGDLILDDAPPLDYQIRSALAHPDFDENQPRLNDIAIIFLKEKVQFSDRISPICLPKVDNVRKMDFAGFRPIAIGWGLNNFIDRKSNELIEKTVPVLSNEDCRAAFSLPSLKVTSKEICAESEDVFACMRDFGGPLMFNSNRTYYLIGVLSSPGSCGWYEWNFLPSRIAVYARTSEYLEWINENLV